MPIHSCGTIVRMRNLQKVPLVLIALDSIVLNPVRRVIQKPHTLLAQVFNIPN